MAEVRDEKLEKKMSRLEKKEAKRIEKLEDKARIKAEKKADREALFKIEDPIGFMRTITIIGVILGVIGLFLGIRYLMNETFMFRYKRGYYSVATENALTHLNVPEGYLPYYNLGNAYYMYEDYDAAISCYKTALESHPTEKKECDIRVNLALAMLHKIDFDNLETINQISNAVRTLQAARNVLTEKGCADPYGTDGHDPEAEQLKQDIDKMLEELDAEPDPNQGDEEEEDQQDQGGSSEEQNQTKREKQLEKELEEQKEESMEERRDADDQKRMEEGDGDESESGGSGSEDGYGGNGVEQPW